MQPAKFDALKTQGYSYIPLVREALADLDTPLSVYLKLADQPYTYLLESIQGGERWGRYSIIGLSCAERIKVFGKRVEHERTAGDIRVREVEDPLAWIQAFLHKLRVPDIPELPRFIGGVVGYFGYETAAYIEPGLAGKNKPDVLQTPDIFLMVSKELIIFDNLGGKIYLIVHVSPDEEHAQQKGEQRLDELVKLLHGPVANPDLSKLDNAPVNFIPEFSEDSFKQAVERARVYIREGDIMQVVLSQRQCTKFTAPPINLYRGLRSLNPSPYMYYLNMGDFYIVGSSPEILVRLEEGEVTVRPIAGTRPRGQDARP